MVLASFLLIFLLFSGCVNNKQEESGTNSAATKSTSNANNTEKVTQDIKDIEKTLNDLQLEKDNENITSDDITGDINSTIDQFGKILSSNTDSVNPN